MLVLVVVFSSILDDLSLRFGLGQCLRIGLGREGGGQGGQGGRRRGGGEGGG